MEILINGEELNFTLENEQNLGDVIQAIENWLSGTNLILTSAELKDEELFSRPQELWQSLSLSEVDTLKITVRHENEVRLANLQTMLEYFSMLKKALETKNSKLLEELGGGFNYLVESIQKHFEKELQQDLLQMNTLFSGKPAGTILAWPEETLQKAAQLIDKLVAGTAARLKEIHNPREALKELIEELTPCIGEISEVSILLQTGKDRQAMESIIRFSELSQSLIRIIGSLKGSPPGDEGALMISGKNHEVFYSEFNRVLKELLEAFKLKDSVLIGDLMEYEMAPRLEELKNFALEIT